MNRTSILLASVFSILVVAGFLLYLSFSSEPGATQQGASLPDTNGLFTATGPSGSFASSSASHPATTQIPTTGGNAAVDDFTKSSTVASSSAGFYLIAYPPVSPNENIDAAASSTPHDYEIYFLSDTGFFDILLLKEPIAETRRSAAKDLADRLGISSDALCTLKYEVNVAYFVNSFYSAKNLGFPGCQGATALPGD